MGKVADVRLSWTKSPSADVAKVQVFVTNNGTETMVEGGAEVEQIMTVVQASAAVQFKIVTFDTEGNQATSEVYSFTLGDLIAPLPATNLGHEVVAVRDDGNPETMSVTLAKKAK